MNPVTKVNPIPAPELKSVTGGAVAPGDSVKPATTSAPVFGSVPGINLRGPSRVDVQHLAIRRKLRPSRR
jgi:hypothetical protein